MCLQEDDLGCYVQNEWELRGRWEDGDQNIVLVERDGTVWAGMVAADMEK